MRNNYLFLTFLVFISVTIYSLNIPFFWDGTFFSEIAVNFYNNGFGKLISPEMPDTGGFPLYSAYLSAIWKIFGKTLPVSHLALLPFILGIIFNYFLLAKKFLKKEVIPLAMILLICEPCFMTQSILMGYDLFMIFFFLVTLNALLSNRKFLFTLAFTFLCLSSVRGIMLGISLFLIDFSIHRKINLNFLKNYVIPFLFVIGWTLYHYGVAGWFLFSPERENTDESIVSFVMFLKQIMYIIWKINDFGRITLWIFLFSAGFMIYKRIKSEFSILLKILFIPLATLIILMAPFANPIGQRYFIVIFLLLNIVVCYITQNLANKKSILIISSIFVVSLITGNFWIYPQRFGNGWDTSLKVLPYFSLKDKMDLFIIENQIQSSEVGTQFPLITDKKFSHLTDSSHYYTDVWSGPIDNHKYFLYSNVINTNIAEEVESVKKTWTLVKQMNSGEVSIALYKNPSY
jgi:hypothetical protein